MEEVRPTRAELLERKQQIALAQQGMDLLKQKRDALLIEFMGVMDETLRLSDSLQKTVSEAQYSLAVAQAVDGVGRASLGGSGHARRDRRGHDRYQDHGRVGPGRDEGRQPMETSFTRGYSVTGVSSRVDESADKFERVLDVIIEYADIETRLKRLGEEINKTNRRVNALEQVTVPALREQVGYISQTLDERAREDLFRLRRSRRRSRRRRRRPRPRAVPLRTATNDRKSRGYPVGSSASGILRAVAAAMIASISRRISMLPRAWRLIWLPRVRILMISPMVSGQKCSSSPLMSGHVGPQFAQDPLELFDLFVVELFPRFAEPMPDEFHGTFDRLGPLEMECSNTKIFFVTHRVTFVHGVHLPRVLPFDAGYVALLTIVHTLRARGPSARMGNGSEHSART